MRTKPASAYIDLGGFQSACGKIVSSAESINNCSSDLTEAETICNKDALYIDGLTMDKMINSVNLAISSAQGNIAGAATAILSSITSTYNQFQREYEEYLRWLAEQERQSRNSR